MEINVKLFGMLEGLAPDGLKLKDVHDTDALLQQLTDLNPKFSQYQFSIAINKKIVDSVTKLNEGDEIALLPPFAGG